MDEMENAVSRPASFGDYICEPALKARLLACLQSAGAKGGLPPHILLSGQAGTGKATLALLMAKTLNLPLFRFEGRDLKQPVQLKELYKTPDCGALVFIDEIHAVSKEIAEVLRSVMARRQVSSPTDPTLIIYLNPLIVVGATTEPARLEKRLLDCFGLKFNLLKYTDAEMLAIVKGMAARMGSLTYTAEALLAIARRSKNIPRIAGSLLFRVNDCAGLSKVPLITCEFVKEALDVDSAGPDIKV